MNHDGVFLVARPVMGGGLFLIGEFYKEIDRTEVLSVLSLLYPFQADRNRIYNRSDFDFLREKFGITNIDEYNESVDDRSLEKYYTPFLCIKSSGSTEYLYPDPPTPFPNILEKKSFVIFYPYDDPVLRAKLFRSVFEKEPVIAVLPGYRLRGDRESVSTLSARYLLRCRYPIENIIRVKTCSYYGSVIENSLDKIDMLKELGFFTDTNPSICIACFSRDIKGLASAIRKLRRRRVIKYKFRFFVESDEDNKGFIKIFQTESTTPGRGSPDVEP